MELEGKNEIEQDLPPEYCHYRDEGCELAESCLSCPFSKCIYDEPGGKRRWLKRLRAREMARLFTANGKGIKELAQMFGVSQRTVQRALKVALGNSTRRGQKNE
jgi:DNA-binding transcriptional ArsR family regulator